MKKHSLYLMKITVGLTILLGVLLILLTNEKSFRKITNKNIENISKLSSSIIYAEIDNSLTKPIFVGQTMANDLFLKKWLFEESPNGDDPEQTMVMQQYLMEYSKKYGYDSVAVTSAKSGVYYYQNGVNKVISKEDPHDVWYYNFLESGKVYDLDVDMDEANNDQLTVFSNCKITDSNGAVLGVVGVGVKMSHLQELLDKCETEYEIKAFLINEQGLVQVDAIEENIETVNFFDRPEIHPLKDKILDNRTSMQIFWYANNDADHCLITKYVSNLDWYIVVENNTKQIEQILTSQINQDLLFIGVIIALVVLIISYAIGKYNRMLLKTASIDDVTNLPNVKMFEEIFHKNTKRPACGQGTLFMFDIDHFKSVNDRFGHLFGNTILYRVSEIAKKTINNSGLIARWGGDEFVGIIYGSPQEADELLQQIVDCISNLKEGDLHNITISMGATILTNNSNLDTMIEEADNAMYRAKENGRNQIIYY